MLSLRLFLFFVLLEVVLCSIGPAFLENEMYSFYYGAPCVQLMDRDTKIGCSSGKNGEEGSLFPLEDDISLTNFLNDPPSEPLTIIISSHLFTKNILSSISAVADLKGVLVLPKQEDDFTSFSPDEKYPNKQYGLYPNSTIEWNPNGSGWSFEQQNAQITAIDEETGAILMPLAYENRENGKYPKWAVNSNAWMYSGKDEDVETCIRRGSCSPVGGKNVWGTINPISPEDRYVMLAAAFDSSAFFHDLAVGSDADISGSVALLGAINALQMVPAALWVRQPLFAFFSAESFGFIGSKAFSKDIAHFSCSIAKANTENFCLLPYRRDTLFTQLDITHIDSFIELNQIGHFPAGAETFTLFPHHDSLSGNVTALMNTLTRATEGSNVTISFDTEAQQEELPPSSLMAFLQQQRNIPGVVMTDHAREYENKFFHSRYDDERNVNKTALCYISRVIARSVFLLGMDGRNDTGIAFNDITVDCEEIEKIYDCFTNSYACNLTKTFHPEYSASGTFPTPTNYAGIYMHKELSFQNRFVYDYVSLHTPHVATNVSCMKQQCAAEFNCLEGVCVSVTLTHLHEAISPAFSYDGTTGIMSLVDTSVAYPQWVESVWSSLYLNVYKIDRPWLDTVVCITGVIELIFCLLGVYFASVHIPQRFVLLIE